MQKKTTSLSNQQPVGPKSEDLKSRFSTRTIPLEADFAALIDVADCGRKAVGQSPDYVANQDTGLVLDSTNGQLKVQAAPNNGIIVNNNGVGITANTAKGMMVDNNGVGIIANTAKGMMVDSNGVGIITNTAKGMMVDNNGVGITANTAKGVMVDNNGVGITANTAKGIMVDNDGVGITVNTAKGVMVDNNGVGITANTAKAITVNSSGVGVNYGSTLTIINNALEVADATIQRKRLSTVVNVSSTTWLKIAQIGSGVNGAYLSCHIMAWNSNFKQRFVITLCCDGSVSYRGGYYSLNMTNCQRQNGSAIAKAGLGIEYYQSSVLDLEISRLNENINLIIDYSQSDTIDAIMYNFSASNMYYRFHEFDTATNAGYQSA